MNDDKTQSERKANDQLLIMTHDGDLIRDPKVRQEMGLLFSDRNRWALPTIPAAPEYEFLRDGQQPVKKSAKFVYRHDPPMPTDNAMVMNRVLRAVMNMSEKGILETVQAYVATGKPVEIYLRGHLRFAFLRHGIYDLSGKCRDKKTGNTPTANAYIRAVSTHASRTSRPKRDTRRRDCS